MVGLLDIVAYPSVTWKEALGHYERALRSLDAAAAPDPARPRREALSLRAVELARRVGGPEAVAATLSARHLASWSPDNADERVGLAGELIDVAGAAGAKVWAIDGHYERIADRLELGDVRGAAADMHAHRRLVEELEMDRAYAGDVALHAGTPRRPPGRPRRGRAARPRGVPPRARGARPGRGGSPRGPARHAGAVQGRTRRRRGGRSRGRRRARGHAGVAMPARLRAGRAGAPDEALAELDAFSADGFGALPRDETWTMGLAALAETCARLEDAARVGTGSSPEARRGERAEALRELLLPHAERYVVLAASWTAWRSVSRYLGLVERLVAPKAATARLEAAVGRNAAIAAWPWVAESSLDLSDALLGRERDGDRRRARGALDEALRLAHDAGSPRLVERVDKRRAALGAAGG